MPKISELTQEIEVKGQNKETGDGERSIESHTVVLNSAYILYFLNDHLIVTYFCIWHQKH